MVGRINDERFPILGFRFTFDHFQNLLLFLGLCELRHAGFESKKCVSTGIQAVGYTETIRI